MIKKYITTILLITLTSQIVFGQKDYEKFIKAIIKGDTVLAKQIEENNITTEPIEVRQFPTRNISEHVFSMPLNQIKDSIVALFDFENQYDNKFLKPIFYFYMSEDNKSENNKMFLSFTAETVKDSLFGKSYFSIPNSSNDIYIHHFGGCWFSKLYFSKGNPLEYRTDFIIKLSALDSNRTKVSIVAESPKIINGIAGFGAHGPVARETKVEPSSIEEYSLLLFIADKLGDNQLAALRLPNDK